MNLDQLTPALVRELLPVFLARQITDAASSERNLVAVKGFVAERSDAELLQLVDALRTLGEERREYRALPLATDLNHMWSKDVVLNPSVSGGHHLADAVNQGPTIVLCNHNSYFDANAAEAVLAWSGFEEMARKLVFVAGPKVYQDLFRKVAAVCLNTIPVPQSSTLGRAAPVSPRELATQMRQSLHAATGALVDGRVLWLYPEGTRSRTGQMQPFVRAVHRWLRLHETLTVVPAAVVGTEAIMPAENDDMLSPHEVRLSFAPGFSAGDDSRQALERAFGAIADMLPEHLAPIAGTPWCR